MVTDMNKVVIMRNNGMSHPLSIFRAARDAGIPLPAAAAMIQQESKGKNIFGHDVGGALSTSGRTVTIQGRTYPPGSDIEVTPARCAIFLIKIAAGEKSNGVGPAQITYAGELPDGRTGGYFRQMLEDDLLPWRPYDNMLFGCRLLANLWDSWGSWYAAFGHYNGGSKLNNLYGAQVVSKMRQWERKFDAA